MYIWMDTITTHTHIYTQKHVLTRTTNKTKKKKNNNRIVSSQINVQPRKLAKLSIASVFFSFSSKNIIHTTAHTISFITIDFFADTLTFFFSFYFFIFDFLTAALLFDIVVVGCECFFLMFAASEQFENLLKKWCVCVCVCDKQHLSTHTHTHRRKIEIEKERENLEEFDLSKNKITPFHFL